MPKSERKKSSMPTRIYSYGALAPLDHTQKIDDQMFFAHQYRNKLVEIELKRREGVNKILREMHPEVAELEAEAEEINARLKEVEDAIDAGKAQSRSARVNPDLKSQASELRKQRKAAWAEFKEAKKEAYADDVLQAKLKGVGESAYAAGRAERAVASAGKGLYWGTYLLIEDSMRGAGTGTPPKFKRYTREGAIGVQIQGGMAAEDALACTDTRLRIEATDHPKRFLVWMRIGSDGRDPVWTRIPTLMHRPLPDDCQIKWVKAHRFRIGSQFKWEVQFTITMPSQGLRTCDRSPESRAYPYHAGSGTVTVTPCYSRVDDGIQVASWVGDDGESGQLVIPDSMLNKNKFSDDLRAVRDVNFNMAIEVLSAWKKGLPCPSTVADHVAWLGSRLSDYVSRGGKRTFLRGEFEAWSNLRQDWFWPVAPSEWFAEATETLGQWRSPGRLAAMIIKWRDNRFAGDEKIYLAMDEWQQRDRHLWDYEANNRDHFHNWRNNHFRVFAANLRKRYAELILDTTEWDQFSKLLKKPVAAEKSDDMKNMRPFLRMCSVGRLVEVVKEAFAGSRSLEAVMA